jgi:hypothetical protein
VPISDQEGLLTETCKPVMEACKNGERGLPEAFKQDMEWSLRILRSVLKGQAIPRTMSVVGPGLSSSVMCLTETKPYHNPIAYDLKAERAKIEKKSPQKFARAEINAAASQPTEPRPVFAAGAPDIHPTCPQLCGSAEDARELQTILATKIAEAGIDGTTIDLDPETSPRAPSFCGDSLS